MCKNANVFISVSDTASSQQREDMAGQEPSLTIFQLPPAATPTVCRSCSG